MKTTTKLQPGIDSRGEVGFANTIGENPKNGGKYQILRLPTPENLIAYEKLPKRIKEALHTRKPIAEVKPGEPILEGQRNDHLTSMAGSMRNCGFGQSAIEAALLKENEATCQPPLPKKEVCGIAESVAKYKPGKVGDKDKKRLTVATRLLEVTKDIGLFHTSDSIPYANIKRDGHTEVWALLSRAVKNYLALLYHEEAGSAPNAQAIQDALNVLQGRALFDGVEEPVYVRLAGFEGNVYLDPCNSKWSVVEITAEGWREVPISPVRFARSRGMDCLPSPQRGGDISAMKDLVNVDSADWSLFLGGLLGCCKPLGPYPVLAITGEQGSAKSTTARMFRSLVDPSTSPLRSLPRDERDLVISASNSWVQAFDNVSYLTNWVSDGICRLATGGGLATRELYTNAEEILFSATRPVILNGIGDIATRSDLLDRSIIITLPTIPDDKRRTEADLWKEFELLRPTFLASLLDAVSLALRNMHTVKLHDMPRMADFAEWVAAGIPALGVSSEEFLDAYRENIQDINGLALESTPAAREIMILAGDLPDGGEWVGTATELLEKLGIQAGEIAERRKDWPKTPRALGAYLNRLAPNFRAIGVDIVRDRGSGERLIHIKKGIQKYTTPTKHEDRCIVTKTERGINIKMAL